ncbi:hypothetical protein FHX82_007020 [Amycolatopsis bartoniae]|uniref:Uncharacterized protein n=1 Tax=Amycolatopsis bartoniae TaxID=941986 RepID=A0A8H9M8M9_9PSEU|nr:hypothetical protein [Amycolatopsis bartoniae]MBB2939934.1 hypothetical protein [Amycolatopsis bartoniae]TVT08283.1 hypothetical protein FNH07_12700 [Amycolatopsis bartoniae]GHF35615.1 hypothetical protein GCM10017566_05620 [Amycolatopsis bartoniae]
MVERKDLADWADQDLLTRDEAGERIDEEISLAEEKLAGLGPDGTGRKELEQRLSVLREVRRSYSAE